MKNILFSWAVCLAILINANSCNNESKETSTGDTKTEQTSGKKSERAPEQFSPDKPYPYETGIIEYQYSGGYEGKSILYFKDYGKTFRLEEDYVNTASPMQVRVQQVFINTPENYTYFNLRDNKGYKEPHTSTANFEKQIFTDFVSMGIDSAMNKNGYKKAENEVIEGKSCQVYKSTDGESQFCFHQGLNIKSELDLGQFKYTLRATKIETDVRVPNDKFDVPGEVKLSSYADYIKQTTKDKL